MGWLIGSLIVAAATLTLIPDTSLQVGAKPAVSQDAHINADASSRARTKRTTGTNSIDSAQPSLLQREEQKRRWGNNNLGLWGKRNSGHLYDDESVVDKRRWGQKNMALWGKRSYYDDTDQWEQPMGKRRWGQKHMNMWGKRADGNVLQLDADELQTLAAQKRKWGQKNMALWG